MQATVIGIGGGSGSGKTTLAQLVAAQAGTAVAMLAFDSYYRDQRHLTPEARRRVNYDHPNSLDVPRFVADLAHLKDGNTLAAPVYDFERDTRGDDIELVEPAPVIVVDGILLFVFPDVCDLIDLKVFVDVPDEVRTTRRIERDVAERGRTHEVAMAQIERTVRPMYGEFVAPSRESADLVIDGTADPRLSAQLVVERLTVQTV